MSEAVKWYEQAGNESDVIFSTRARLARNLVAYPFPDRANQRQKEEIEEQVSAALMSASNLMPSQFAFIPLDTLSQEEAVSLVERYLVSPGFISDITGKAVLCAKDERISIMINEEDHVRIQAIEEGFCPKSAYETADRLDTLLSEHLDFAFDDTLGYLTQCPTNLGTALRISVMMHLPALTEYAAIPRMTANLSKLGMIIRGSYGEGSKVSGAMYQLSNQVTLGLSEQAALENLSAIAGQLIKEEREQRLHMIENIGIQDRVYRSAGILKTARILSTSDFMELISNVRLGISTGLLQGITPAEINKLIAEVQPATLAAQNGGSLRQSERDVQRANLARTACKKLEG